MLNRIADVLQELREGGYRSPVDLPLPSNEPAGERRLVRELNALLEFSHTSRRRAIEFKAGLLSDIDALAEVLGRISLGQFDVALEPLKLAEMDTLSIGIEDMADRLRQVHNALEQKLDELRASETQVRRERELAEAATRAKSEFLANMSHEIRTPLNAVIGLSELALAARPEERQAGYLKKIRNAGKILLSVVNDVLDFSKIEAGQMEVESAPFSVRDVFDGVADMFSAAVAHKGLELVFSCDSSVPTSLVGDGMRVGQILINLVSNAVKFTEQGEVVVSAALVLQEQTGAVVRFDVRDTGIGILEHKLPQLFESFTQADSSTTRQYGGTGLGLAICKRLVELMDGSITVVSKPGIGSTFSFAVVLRVDDSKTIVRPSLPNELHGRRVLVVEDNESSRNYLSETLAGYALSVATAGSGAEALIALAEAQPDQRFDLVLMDWRLPDLDGLEVTRRIRDLPDLSATPVVMVTAYGDEQLKRDAARVGIRKFLVKPVRQSHLLNCVVDVFGHRLLEEITSTDSELHLSPAHRRCRNARVLLVEDNSINQQVAREMLETANIMVVVAANGEEAFMALEESTYDAILMDVQMPVLDGLAATRAIRAGRLRMESPARTGTLPPARQRIPIIAMTAHALKGDREACLEAGMDDYLKKPVDARDLFAVLARWVAPTSPAEDQGQRRSRPPQSEIHLPKHAEGLDLEAALRRVGGNRHLLVKLLREFSRDFAETNVSVREILELGDFSAARRSAHTLKGMALVFGAESLAEAAAALERACADEDRALIEVQLERLAAPLQHVLSTVDIVVETAGRKHAANRIPRRVPTGELEEALARSVLHIG